MQPSLASGHIRTARATIRLATQICGAADLTALQRALNLLQTTVPEMRLAEAALRAANLNERVEVQREAALLKREVACLMRVIDGCAALYRGLGIRLGCSGLSYSPQSYSCQSYSCRPRSLAAPAGEAACEMQG